MYRIEFKKILLEAQYETIGEVAVQKLYLDGEFVGTKVRAATLYKTGTKFSTKEEAEKVAKQFEALYSGWPEVYKVTTEVYKVKK